MSAAAAARDELRSGFVGNMAMKRKFNFYISFIFIKLNFISLLTIKL